MVCADRVLKFMPLFTGCRLSSEASLPKSKAKPKSEVLRTRDQHVGISLLLWRASRLGKFSLIFSGTRVMDPFGALLLLEVQDARRPQKDSRSPHNVSGQDHYCRYIPRQVLKS